MKRREFLMLASATAFAKQSLAEETKPTIGVLAAGVPSPEEFLESFREGLRDRGYIEGKIFRLLSNRLKVIRIVFPNWRRNSFAAKSL